MTTQPELPWRQPATSSRERGGRDLGELHAELVALLRGRGWVGSGDLAAAGYSDRLLREIVEQDGAGQILSYPGSRGYRLFDEASLAEIERADSLRSQSRRMLARWLRYQRRRHSHGATRPAG